MTMSKEKIESLQAIIRDEIMKINPTSVPMYDELKDTTTIPGILITLNGFVLHEFEMPPSTNLMEKLEGKIIMEDLESVMRDLEGEAELCYYPNQGVVRFCLWHLLDDQSDVGKRRVSCFGLNTCKINLDDPSLTAFKLTEQGFADLIHDGRPLNIFRKKLLVFPVIYRYQSYVTVVINPFAAVRIEGVVDDAKSVIIHYGTGAMNEYKTWIVPRILHILGLFVQLYSMSEGYQRIQPEKIRTIEKELPQMPRFDRPIQLVYVVQKLLKLASRHGGFKEMEEEALQIGEDPVVMKREMAQLRAMLGHWIRLAVNSGPKEAAAYIFDKRCQIAAHEKEQRLAKRKKAIDAEIARQARESDERIRQKALEAERIKDEALEAGGMKEEIKQEVDDDDIKVVESFGEPGSSGWKTPKKEEDDE